MATRNLSACNSAGQWHDKIRIIIIRFRTAVTEVNHFMTGFAQFPGQIFFQLVTAVIGSDADSFRFRQDGKAVRHISLWARTAVAAP
jgi:hypothetical protein